MVYAIGAGAIFQSQFHLLSHSVFKALLFLGGGRGHPLRGNAGHAPDGRALARSMPLTCVVFFIGALALAGIPPVNGFWSKEMVLEAGLAYGPVLGVRRDARHRGPDGAVHPAVRVDGLLRAPASGDARPRGRPGDEDRPDPARRSARLVTWLLAGPFQELLARTLPLHFPAGRRKRAEASPPRGQIAAEVLSAPSTWLALGGRRSSAAALWAGRARVRSEAAGSGPAPRGVPRGGLRVRVHQPRDRRRPCRRPGRVFA